MSNNTHTYTTTTTVTETLPPGRFLIRGDIRKAGDLFCYHNTKPQPILPDRIGETLETWEEKNHYWYRPDPVQPPVAKQRHDGLKCQKGYRFLDADESIQGTDEVDFTRAIGTEREKWEICDDTNWGNGGKVPMNTSLTYRRKLEKKPRVRKTGYRFLKEGEITKKDDDYNWGNLVCPNWEKVMPAIYGEKGGYAVTKIAADCKFYRRRLR
jgi:hypothetical protein